MDYFINNDFNFFFFFFLVCILNSIIGGMLLVLSLYSVLWGKKKEMNCHDTENYKTDSVPMEKEMLDHI